MGGVDDLLMWVDLYTLRCGGFTQLRRPGVEVKAWQSVIVVAVGEWPRGDVIAGAGGLLVSAYVGIAETLVVHRACG